MLRVSYGRGPIKSSGIRVLGVRMEGRMVHTAWLEIAMVEHQVGSVSSVARAMGAGTHAGWDPIPQGAAASFERVRISIHMHVACLPSPRRSKTPRGSRFSRGSQKVTFRDYL